ncbi:MAG TPA: TIGR00725 family protein [Solirubrobacteraceae bacterium]|nr:TIGR00725 family protein [Solirubrobacteraceae bacterium]
MGTVVYVGVIGPGMPGALEDETLINGPDRELLRAANEVGRLLAEAGVIVVCGGLGGVMAAASKGARSAGGQCVGILPGPDRSEANEFLSLALPTGIGEARNALVVCASDVLIAIGGGFGTLSEIALALRSDKHVVGLLTWSVAELDPQMHTVTSAPAAASLALELAGPEARDGPR